MAKALVDAASLIAERIGSQLPQLRMAVGQLRTGIGLYEHTLNEYERAVREVQNLRIRTDELRSGAKKKAADSLAAVTLELHNTERKIRDMESALQMGRNMHEALLTKACTLAKQVDFRDMTMDFADWYDALPVSSKAADKLASLLRIRLAEETKLREELYNKMVIFRDQKTRFDSMRNTAAQLMGNEEAIPDYTRHQLLAERERRKRQR